MKNGMKVLNSFNSAINVCQQKRLNVLYVGELLEESQIRQGINVLVKRRSLFTNRQVQIQCLNCERWFKSKGGLKVHKCMPTQQCDI